MEKYYNINAEGCSIRCKLYADTMQPERMIVYGHGFCGHKGTKAAEHFAARLLEKNRGSALLCFDWPCHGEDVRKVLRLEDCDRYLRLVVEDLRSRFAPARLDGYATSFGGYLFLKSLSEGFSPFAKIALRCPAVCMYRVLSSAIMDEEGLRQLERGKSVPVGFDRKIAVDRIFLESLREADLTRRDFLPWADDILILHGTADEIVPFADVRQFAEDNVIDFVPVEGADHRFQHPKAMELATKEILRFLDLK